MPSSLSLGRLSELIGMIYDAAIDPSLWPVAIDEIRKALEFDNATFTLQALPSGEVLINVTSNIPQHYLDRMAGYGGEVLDQWGGLAALRALPMDQPAVLSRVNPDAVRFDVTTNRYSLEWAKPQGLVDVMALGLAFDERGLGSLAFGRHESAGPIGEREIEAARFLIPHLQRAATVNRLLDMAAIARSTFEAVLDTLTAPIFLTSADLHVVHANPAALELVATGGLLSVRNGVLVANVSAVSSALAVAVAQAARDEGALARKGLGVPVRWQDDSAGALHVLPLRPGRGSFDASVVAAVFVARADTPFVAPTALVAALFGLTPAEARVFEQIAVGRTVEETSEVLSIGRSTVRTHLLRLFEKTGARRQAELVQLAASLAAPLAASTG
ncbi:helix-turn-helix transcriptional regulator [Mesorhizobium sp. BH1-1-4]|uniref:helix-turn-helix transcriptional regulator n=1 Tax=Mesorhizobium sp. BH1-1-4 TaxID=2876662 RepID=UPI001CD18BFB|nr:LuxR C-terminal-related transcriptional regulator [Mesorhizobium sp. BH1-1-4]MBZ9996465.1 helix-turn-helix transcriptional regulator [Mesorhizobium sp. BH1-1-4]